MFKLSPTYYLGKAVNAKDYLTYSQAWLNYWKTTQLQAMFICDKAFAETEQFCKSFFERKL